MEVILKKNIDKLGYKDEVVTVKPGYGRNFLIPQGYASLATPSAKKAHEDMMKQRSHKESKIVAEAEAIAAKLADVTVKISTKVGENGKIFGSVNTIQIADALKKAGFEMLESTPTFLPFWKNGTRFFNVKGPSGETIEFNQIL